MRTHQVQIDNDVFEFVKANAEPLVDDFNSALRRLLALGGAKSRAHSHSPVGREASQGRVLSDLPPGTPVALRHILEVAHLVRSGKYSRTAATQVVAKQDQVFPQTVIDKYCRQLGLTARGFDVLLQEENLNGLRKLLKSKYAEQIDLIDQFAK